MKYIRANGVPILVTAFMILAGFMGTFLGLQAMLDGTAAMGYVEGAEALGVTWGGRNTGLGIALLVAVLLRSAHGYSVALAASLFREISDILASDSLQVVLIVFLLIEIVCLLLSLRPVVQNWSYDD